MGKSFKFMVFTFLENALNLGIFTHVPSLLTQCSPLSSYHHILVRRKLLILNYSLLNWGGGNYDLLYQNSIRKYESGLEH